MATAFAVDLARAAPEIGEEAPPLVLTAIDGTAIDLAKLRGKVVLVNFWATWCAPCRKEMPTLDAFYRRHRGQKFELIGISIDFARDAAKMCPTSCSTTWSFPCWRSERAMKCRIVCAISLAGRAAAVAAALVLAVPVAARCAETGGWIFDTAAGCKVWNPHPQPNETIRWSGACANGMAQGRGAAQWFRGNLPFESDEGEWREGRQAGYGTQVWPTGRYDGELVDGEPNGHGTLIVQGLRYEGELRNGKPNGFGTLVNVSGTFRGTWKDGCLQDSTRWGLMIVPPLQR